MPDQPFTQVSYARRDQADWTTLDRPAQRNADMREGIGAYAR